MSKIDLATAKVHLRVDDTADDMLINQLIAAAYLAVEGVIFRKVYADAVPADDATGMLSNALIDSAALLILGHLYANRESVIAGTIATELPMGAQWLLVPYINTAGGF